MKIYIRTLLILLLINISIPTHIVWGQNEPDYTELKKQLEEQKKLNNQQEMIIQHQEYLNNQQDLTIQKLIKRMDRLEQNKNNLTSVESPQSIRRVSLVDEEVSGTLSTENSNNVLANPWYKNIHIDGFGAGGFVSTGGNAVKQDGSFLNYEATINVDAKVWEDIHYFHEIQTVRLGDEDTKFLRTGEVYVHFKDILNTLFNLDGKNVGLKIGRMDIPFGEDYLTQDIVDNPLITLSAAYPYGFDEGLVFHSTYQDGVKWVAAIMDGTDSRALEDNNSKFLSLKLYDDITENLYLSASGFYNGESAKSAWEFGGSHFRPIGAGGLASSLGSSGSSTVDAYSFEMDGKYAFGHDRYLKLQLGYANLDDDNSTFDRDIYYFQVEPKWNLGERYDHKWYVVSRFSAIGTFENNEGYEFAGKPFAGGSATFGYDTTELYRYAIGLGFAPNPRTVIKLEYSKDDYKTLSSSLENDGSDGRDLVGIITAVKF